MLVYVQGRLGSTITIYDEHVTPEGFADGYFDNHELMFDNDEDHARFRELFLEGQKLGELYYRGLHDLLITAVVDRGYHRPNPTA